MPSSTRFNAGSSSEIWLHLNVLDDATIRVVETRAALLALESPAAGMFAFETDHSVLWRYTGTQWRPVGTPEFTSTAVRDAVLAQPLANDRCLVSSVVASVTYWTEYRHDGTAWRVWDSPWATVPLISGFTHVSGYTFEYRMSSGVVVYRGGVTSAGLAVNVGTTIVAAAGIPADFRPSPTKFFLASVDSLSKSGQFIVSVDGSMQLVASSALSSYYLSDMIRFAARA